MEHTARWEDYFHMPALFQATAIFPWQPQEEGELALAVGDKIDILDCEGEWWLGRREQEIGEVPYNFLTYEGAEQSTEQIGLQGDTADNEENGAEQHAIQHQEYNVQPPPMHHSNGTTSAQQQAATQNQQQQQMMPQAPSRPASGRPRSSRHLRAQTTDAAIAPEVLQTLAHIVDERLLHELKVRDSMLETMKTTVQQLERQLQEQSKEWRRLHKRQQVQLQRSTLPPMSNKPSLGLSSLSDSALTVRQPRGLRTQGSRIPVRRAYVKQAQRNHLPPVSRALSDDLTRHLNSEQETYNGATSTIADAPTANRQQHANGTLPEQTLRLQFVYGYRGERHSAGSSSASTNVKWLPSGEIIFAAAAVVVIYDHRSNTQRFFLGHDHEVGAIAICPGTSIVASSEIGTRESNGKICIYDTAEDDPVRGDSITLLHALTFPPIKGAALLDFSPDGELLVAFGQDEAHTVVVYDWRAEVVVAELRTQNLDVHGAMFHPFQWMPATNFSPAMYTMLSCGSRHMRFWTITQQVTDESPTTKRASPGRSALKGASRVWQVEHATASLGKHADIRDVTCLCCVKDSERDDVEGMPQMGRIISGTSSGSLCIWTHLAEFDGDGKEMQFLRWQPRGKLTSIIKDVHEGGVLDITYLESRQLLATAGKDGVVSLWKFEPASGPADQRRNPLTSLFSSQISASAPAIGPARSIAWDPTGSTLVLGTTGSAVCLLTMQCAENGEPTDSLGLRMLLRGHSNKIRGIAAHPTQLLFVTVSADRTLRLWDSSTCRIASLTRLPDKCTAVAMSPAGDAIAVGTEEGEVFVLTTPLLLDPQLHLTKDHHKPQPPWEVLARRTLRSKQHAHQAESARISMQTGEEVSPSKTTTQATAPEVTCLQYSPDGKYLAVGCRDNSIHLLGANNHYKRVGVCRGHTSTVLRLDFAQDGLYLQSCDQSRELLYWHVPSAKQVTNASQMRNVEWATWTCSAGWAIRGASDTCESSADLGAVCRSNNKTLLASSDRARIKLARFPCPEKSEQREFRGHSSSVQDMAFLAGDGKLLTAGGLDATVLQWKVVVA